MLSVHSMEGFWKHSMKPVRHASCYSYLKNSIIRREIKNDSSLVKLVFHARWSFHCTLLARTVLALSVPFYSRHESSRNPASVQKTMTMYLVWRVHRKRWRIILYVGYTENDDALHSMAGTKKTMTLYGAWRVHRKRWRITLYDGYTKKMT